MSVHQNSHRVYTNHIGEINNRARDVYHRLCHAGPMTDREILHAMFPGSDDMNKVRPRISELKDERWIVELRDVEDATTHVKVRKVKSLTVAERALLIQREQEQAERNPTLELFAA